MAFNQQDNCIARVEYRPGVGTKVWILHEGTGPATVGPNVVSARLTQCCVSSLAYIVAMARSSGVTDEHIRKDLRERIPNTIDRAMAPTFDSRVQMVGTAKDQRTC